MVKTSPKVINKQNVFYILEVQISNSLFILLRNNWLDLRGVHTNLSVVWRKSKEKNIFIHMCLALTTSSICANPKSIKTIESLTTITYLLIIQQ